MHAYIHIYAHLPVDGTHEGVEEEVVKLARALDRCELVVVRQSLCGEVDVLGEQRVDCVYAAGERLVLSLAKQSVQVDLVVR